MAKVTPANPAPQGSQTGKVETIQGQPEPPKPEESKIQGTEADQVKNAPPEINEMKKEASDLQKSMEAMPTMTPEEIKKALETMPANQRQAIENYFGAKNSGNSDNSAKIPAEQKTPLEMEDEQIQTDEQALHAFRIKKYGDNYIVVQKPAIVGQAPKMTKVFSAHAWKNLGPAKKDGSKEGWVPAVKTPPEVKNLKSKF